MTSSDAIPVVHLARCLVRNTDANGAGSVLTVFQVNAAPEVSGLDHGYDQQAPRPCSFVQQLLLPCGLHINVLALGLHHVFRHALLYPVLH